MGPIGIGLDWIGLDWYDMTWSSKPYKSCQITYFFRCQQESANVTLSFAEAGIFGWVFSEDHYITMDMVVHGMNLSAGDQIANNFYEKNTRVCCSTEIFK